MSALLALSVLWPLALLALLRWPRARAAALVLAPLPLLVLAFAGSGAGRWPLLALGIDLAVDAVNQPLLYLAGVGWLLAGAFAASRVGERAAVFAAFWLVTLAGQALVLLAADVAGFYAGYLTMTLAAYGLVVHAGSDEALRAGRVYLVLALAGEALVLGGVLLLAGQFGNAGFVELAASDPGPATWLLLVGFSVKLGIVPLHVWLPLAHPVAPVPASAVLSGLLVKAGLLGLLRFLPAGAIDAAGVLFALGLFTAAYGAVVGLGQARLKTVLAYSTISQMGLLLCGFAALQRVGPELALPALGLLALHHGLNKTALFLAAGGQVGASAWRGVLFALPALALVGVPMLSGAVAKPALKEALTAAEWTAWLGLLGVSSLLTALLLLRAWHLARADRPDAGERAVPVHPAWPLAVLAGLVLPWWWAAQSGLLRAPWYGLFDALWPVAVAALVALVWRRWFRHRRWALPEGDLLLPVQRTAGALVAAAARVLDAWLNWRLRLPMPWPDARRLARIEQALVRLPVAGGLLLLILLAIAWF